MSKNIQKIEKAMELITEARRLIDSVVYTGVLKNFQIASNYYIYNEYGLNQAMGNNNPFDGKLQDLIDKLKEENL